MFPMSGSRVALTIQFTPPYSLFRKDNFWVFTDEEVDELHRERLLELGIRQREEYFTTVGADGLTACLLYTSPSPRDQRGSRMPSSA